MVLCSVIGCSNRSDGKQDISFHCFPRIRENQGDATRELCIKRRERWKANINRDLPDEKWENTSVCSRHFVGGKCHTIIYISL